MSSNKLFRLGEKGEKFILDGRWHAHRRDSCLDEPDIDKRVNGLDYSNRFIYRAVAIHV